VSPFLVACCIVYMKGHCLYERREWLAKKNPEPLVGTTFINGSLARYMDY
jgi:hypothetical protein